jgi:single-strand DNA-binding protein
MASVNRIVLVGYLGKDPEVSTTKTGRAVVKFTLATSERWKKDGKPDGEVVERTDWHNIICWGRLADIAAKYLNKGSCCYIEGRVHYESWDDVEGKRHYATKIDAVGLQLLPGKSTVEKKEVPDAVAAQLVQEAVVETVDTLPGSIHEVVEGDGYPF